MRFAEQRTFTGGCIVVRSNKAERRKGKRADYLLSYTRDMDRDTAARSFYPSTDAADFR